MTVHARQGRVAKGSTRNGKGYEHRQQRVAIGFAPEMFKQIAAMAEARRAPFATIVRELCERALRRREH